MRAGHSEPVAADPARRLIPEAHGGASVPKFVEPGPAPKNTTGAVAGDPGGAVGWWCAGVARIPAV